MDNPANTRRWPSVGIMLGQRRRRWANFNSTLGKRLVFAGKGVTADSPIGPATTSIIGAKIFCIFYSQIEYSIFEYARYVSAYISVP